MVTFVAGVGDISTDLLSPGGDAHSRSDRELHGQCLFEHNKEKQNELLALQNEHPDKRVMLIAEKGTMGVGSSRMSGVNNVALWTGIKASPYVPFINIAPIIAGTNGISPIFLTTVGVTGGIGIDLQNWVKQKDADGNTIVDKDGEPVLKQEYSVETGTVLTINTKTKKLYNGGKELKDISTALTPQKMEFIKAGGSYAVVFGKKLQTFAAKALGIEAIEGNVYSDDLLDNIELNDVGYLLALTASATVNKYVLDKFSANLGEQGAFRLISTDEMLEGEHKPDKNLFTKNDDYINLSEVVRDYPFTHEIIIESKEHYINLLKEINFEKHAIPVFMKDISGTIHIIATLIDDSKVEPGNVLMYVGKKII